MVSLQVHQLGSEAFGLGFQLGLDLVPALAVSGGQQGGCRCNDTLGRAREFQ